MTSKSHHHHKTIFQLLLDGFTCRFFTAKVKKKLFLTKIIKFGAKKFLVEVMALRWGRRWTEEDAQLMYGV